MNIQNIYNKHRKVYFFIRNSDGTQTIKEDNSFFPYFYEPETTGTSISFNGQPLKKIFCTLPKDVKTLASSNAWESDVHFCRRYAIDKIKSFSKSPTKYFLIDVEMLTPELPTWSNPKYPISCISIYNSASNNIQTWYLGDYLKKLNNNYDLAERKLLTDFVHYIRQEKPDLILGWNIDNFDYPYMYHRYKRLFKQDLGIYLSPVNENRMPSYGKDEDKQLYYPAGISIVDLLTLFKKIYQRESSYALDNIAQTQLGEQAWQETKFNVLDESIKAKNIHDVERMEALNNKFNIIDYYDSIRRLAKVAWEDLYWNSRVIESLLFDEAKKQGVVLPNKPEEQEEQEFQGATRESERTGLFFNAAKTDLGSAYPNMMINFCLDPANIRDQEVLNSININGTWFEQKENSLLPAVAKRMITLKTNIKTKLKTLDVNSIEYKDIKILYEGVKGVVNSVFGVCGNRYFRLYNNKVAGAITFLVRDVLIYVKNNVYIKNQLETIYHDTDGLTILTEDNIAPLLNSYVQEWAQRNYQKEHIDLEFEQEGIYTSLLLLKKCRYVGYLRKPDGTIEKEVKGVESKRRDSSKYLQKFHTELIDKILNKETQEAIELWIQQEVETIMQHPLEDLAFPCKIAQRKYKNKPIFIRAYEYANRLDKNFIKHPGDPFYYIYVIPKNEEVSSLYLGRKKITKEIMATLTPEELEKVKTRVREVKGEDNVIAFDKKTKDNITNVDWTTVLNRNIYNKLSVIYDALGWKTTNPNIKLEEE